MFTVGTDKRMLLVNSLLEGKGGKRESQEVADALPIVPVEQSSGVSCRNQHPFPRTRKLD
jgi:hypothetical protein